MAGRSISGLSSAGSSWMAIASAEGDGVVVRLYNPQSWNGAPSDVRTGVLDLKLGHRALVGLTPPVLAMTIAEAIVSALGDKYARPKAPAPPDGGHGGEQCEGQLRLDLL